MELNCASDLTPRLIYNDRIVYVDSIRVRQVDNLQELSVSTEVLSEPHKMPQVFERMIYNEHHHNYIMQCYTFTHSFEIP